MLRNSSEIIGYTIGASDGQLGKVTDVLFGAMKCGWFAG